MSSNRTFFPATAFSLAFFVLFKISHLLDIMLHLGTLIAVLIFFRKEISDIIKALPDDFMSIYFEEFRIVFLYIRNKRKLYMEYEKFSI